MGQTNVAMILQDVADSIEYVVIANVKGKTENRSKWQASILFKEEDRYRVAFHDDPIVALGVALYTKRSGQPYEEGVKYWHHPESGTIFKTRATDPDPREGNGADRAHIEEIDRAEYHRLSIEYSVRDVPLLAKEGDKIEPEDEEDDFSDLL